MAGRRLRESGPLDPQSFLFPPRSGLPARPSPPPGPPLLLSLSPAPLAPLRARPAALARSRSIWPRGSVTQISPIHSSLTPLIGFALKLVRLTSVADFPRSTVFR